MVPVPVNTTHNETEDRQKSIVFGLGIMNILVFAVLKFKLNFFFKFAKCRKYL